MNLRGLASRKLIRDEEACVECGACVGQCRSGALFTDRISGCVLFDRAVCVSCRLCVPACSYRALRLVDEGGPGTGGHR